MATTTTADVCAQRTDGSLNVNWYVVAVVLSDRHRHHRFVDHPERGRPTPGSMLAPICELGRRGSQCRHRGRDAAFLDKLMGPEAFEVLAEVRALRDDLNPRSDLTAPYMDQA